LLRPQRQRGALDFGSPLRRCTDTLLVANAVMFAAQWLTRDALTLWGAKVNALVAAGQVWRLLTSSLLHTSLFHLLVRARLLSMLGRAECCTEPTTFGQHLWCCGSQQRFGCRPRVEAASPAPLPEHP
jgi:hypothetical protein